MESLLALAEIAFHCCKKYILVFLYVNSLSFYSNVTLKAEK